MYILPYTHIDICIHVYTNNRPPEGSQAQIHLSSCLIGMCLSLNNYMPTPTYEYLCIHSHTQQMPAGSCTYIYRSVALLECACLWINICPHSRIHVCIFIYAQNRCLKEAEHRSTFLLPYWNVPVLGQGLSSIVPRQREFAGHLRVYTCIYIHIWLEHTWHEIYILCVRGKICCIYSVHVCT